MIKIKRVESKKVSDIYLYNKNQEEKFLEIDKTMLNGYFSMEIEKFSTKLILSLMYYTDKTTINLKIKKIYDEFEKNIRFKSVEVVSKDKINLMKECIIEKVFSQLTGGIFRCRKLPSNEFINLLKNKLIKNTLSESDIFEMKDNFEKFYRMQTHNKAMEFIIYIVTNILKEINKDKLENNREFEKICKDLLLTDDDIEIEKIKKRIKEKNYN